MRRVVLESPFAGDIQRNITYARRAVRHSVMQGEAPIASHLLFTQDGILRDNDPQERRKGIEAGHAWVPGADAMVVYTDYGISEGMWRGIREAEISGVKIEKRTIGVNP